VQDPKQKKRIRSILGYLQSEPPPDQMEEPTTPDNDDADFTQAGEPASISGTNLKKKKRVPIY
jgi:hypothetical protein